MLSKDKLTSSSGSFLHVNQPLPHEGKAPASCRHASEHHASVKSSEIPTAENKPPHGAMQAAPTTDAHSYPIDASPAVLLAQKRREKVRIVNPAEHTHATTECVISRISTDTT